MLLPKTKSSALFSNTFFIFLCRFFTSFANLVVVILYSRYLPKDSYGNYSHFWIHLNIIYPIACFGIHILIVTYPPAFILNLVNKLKPAHYLVYFIWLLLLGTLFAVLQYTALGIPFFIPLLFIIAYSIIIVLESLLIVFKKYIQLIALNFLYSGVFIAIHFYFLGSNFSLPAIFLCLLVATILKLIAFVGVILKSQIDFKTSETMAEYEALPKVRSLWLHLGCYDVSQTFFNWIDKFIISLVLTSSLSAIYFNGSMNIPFLPLLLTAAGSSVLMQLAVGKKHDEVADTISLINSSGKILSSIVFPIFYFLLVYRYDLITGFFSMKYEAAVPIFAMSLLVLPLRAYNFTTVLQRFHKGRILNIGGVADLVIACALMYPLYILLGLKGVALSFVVSTYLQALFYLYFAAKALQVKTWALIPYFNWLMKLTLFGILFISIHYIGQVYFSKLFALILGGTLTMIIVLISLWIEIKASSTNKTF